MKSEIQDKAIFQLHSYSCLSRCPILHLCLNFLSMIESQSQLHPSRYFFDYLVKTNMKLKIQVQMTSLFHHFRTLLGYQVGTIMEPKIQV